MNPLPHAQVSTKTFSIYNKTHETKHFKKSHEESQSHRSRLLRLINITGM